MMKYFVALAALVFVFVAFAGCGGGDNAPTWDDIVAVDSPADAFAATTASDEEDRLREERRRMLTANEEGQLGRALRDVSRLCEAAGCLDAESHADIAREMWLVEVVDGGMRRFSYVSANVQNAIRDLHGD